MKLVMVEWVDSKFGGNSWISRGEANNELPAWAVTAGILTTENDICIVVSSSFAEVGDVCQSIAIPRDAIKRIRYLKVRDGD